MVLTILDNDYEQLLCDVLNDRHLSIEYKINKFFSNMTNKRVDHVEYITHLTYKLYIL